MNVSTRGQEVGLKLSNAGENETNADPWLRSPTGKPKNLSTTETAPDQVRGVLSQRLYVQKTGLSSPLLNLINRLAAFQNPEFYKKQNLRLSTAMTPRVISCAENHGKYISLPRGCLDGLRTLLHKYNSHLELDDLRISGDPLDVSFFGELTDAQHQVAKGILEHDNGVMASSPLFICSLDPFDSKLIHVAS